MKITKILLALSASAGALLATQNSARAQEVFTVAQGTDYFHTLSTTFTITMGRPSEF